MPAIRCKECRFVSAKNEGFCPECGAMYVEPFDYVDESLVGSAQRPPTRHEKKKGGGLLSSLFGGGKRESEAALTDISPRPTHVQHAPPADVPRDQLKIRCQECKHIVPLDGHEGYCPDCGAFFVEPHEYITADSLAAEKAAETAARDSYRPVEKSFDQMNDQEKLAHLKEQVADTWDQIIKDRHVLNEKANECMQCFTAAGTIKSEDQYEVLASTIKQRYHNLEDFELVYADYKRLLADFSKQHEQLLQAQQNYVAYERQLTPKLKT
jgi:Zn finger protein HypA/HybF involved in hydrogenase expression